MKNNNKSEKKIKLLEKLELLKQEKKEILYRDNKKGSFSYLLYCFIPYLIRSIIFGFIIEISIILILGLIIGDYSKIDYNYMNFSYIILVISFLIIYYVEGIDFKNYMIKKEKETKLKSCERRINECEKEIKEIK